MNIGVSIKIALAKNGKKIPWLAAELDVKRQTVNNWSNQTSVGGDNIEKLASVFNMTASEFIALGE